MPESETLSVIAKGRAGVFNVDTGQVLRLVQLDGGGQVVDVLPFNREDLGEHLWGSKTAIAFGLHPTVGAQLVSVGPRERALMTIVGDSLTREPSTGGFRFHDVLCCCSKRTIVRRFGPAQERPGCFDLLCEVLQPLGVPAYAVHDCYNPFMRTGYNGERRTYEVSDAPAGSYVELRAEMDLVVAISSCPGASSRTDAKGIRVEVRR
jgi:uncharacterized protein YcgI (DUF1989 family)